MEGTHVQTTISEELSDLFQSDQKDRESWNNEELRKKGLANDAVRLARAEIIYSELQKKSLSLSEDDYVHLAYLFQHGKESRHYRIAQELAEKGGEKGRWLSAAAEDRYLLSIGQKQRWGTQFFTNADGIPSQFPMMSDEESGITDSMRLERGIPARTNQLSDFNKT